MLVNFTPGMRFGVGVDTTTEDVRGAAILFDGVTDGSGGQRVASRLRLVESQESLFEAMSISVSASARYGLANGDLKLKFASDHTVNRYSLHLLLTVSVRNTARYMRNPRLSEAAMVAYRRDPDAFHDTYGDGYIDEIYTGGEFLGLFTFETFSDQARMELRSSLNASIGTFFIGGEVQSSFAMAIEEAKTRANMEIRVFRSGGSGVENPTDIEQLKELYRSFNAQVLEHPVEFMAGIKEFKYLPLPEGPTWAEKALRTDTIRRCGQLVIEGIKQRSDIGFVLKYPDQFEPHDGQVLRQGLAQLEAFLPGVASRAHACAAKGECSLAGLEPPHIVLPERRTRQQDPLEQKWLEIQRDSRAVGYFPMSGLKKPISQADHGPHGGRFILFHRSNGDLCGGLFWHPDIGAHAVYGGIFVEYLARGHCEGPLGYPKSDEMTVTEAMSVAPVTGRDRISFFEHGKLWWDHRTLKVSEFLLSPAELLPADSEAARGIVIR